MIGRVINRVWDKNVKRLKVREMPTSHKFGFYTPINAGTYLVDLGTCVKSKSVTSNTREISF